MKKLQCKIEQTLSQFKYIGYVCEEKNEKQFYQNQEETAWNLMNFFLSNEVYLYSLIALTQCGKTGTLLNFLKIIFEHPDYSKKISPDNTYIITGFSDTAWKDQMKQTTPALLFKNVFHGGELKQFKESVKGKKDVMIVIDEVDYAGQEGNQISEIFDELKYNDINHLKNNNIHILQVSATPDGILVDSKKVWGDYHKKTLMITPDNYISVFKLLDEEYITKNYDLKNVNNQDKLIKYISENYTLPKYHIVRIHNESRNFKINNLKQKIEKKGMNVIEFYQSNKNDINEIIKNIPTKNTIILIKEKLRCSKTLKYKKNLGVMFERFTNNPIDSSIIQGMAGRATGYYNLNECQIKIFTNIDTIIRYKYIYESQFDYSVCKWVSNTYKNGKSKSRNKVLKIGGKRVVKLEPIIEEKYKYNHEKPMTLQELKQYQNNEKDNNLDKTIKSMYNYRKMKNSNLFGCVIGTGSGKYGKKKILSTEETIEEIEKSKQTVKDGISRFVSLVTNKGKSKKHDKLIAGDKYYYIIICYDDINDKSTEKYIIKWFIKK